MKLRIVCQDVDFEWIGSQLKLKEDKLGSSVMNWMIQGVVNTVTPERLVMNYLKLNPGFIKNQLEKLAQSYGIRASFGKIEFYQIEKRYYLDGEIYWVDAQSLLKVLGQQLEGRTDQMGVRSLRAAFFVLQKPLADMLSQEGMAEAIVSSMIREQADLIQCLETLLTIEGHQLAKIISISQKP